MWVYCVQGEFPEWVFKMRTNVSTTDICEYVSISYTRGISGMSVKNAYAGLHKW